MSARNLVRATGGRLHDGIAEELLVLRAKVKSRDEFASRIAERYYGLDSEMRAAILAHLFNDEQKGDESCSPSTSTTTLGPSNELDP